MKHFLVAVLACITLQETSRHVLSINLKVERVRAIQWCEVETRARGVVQKSHRLERNTRHYVDGKETIERREIQVLWPTTK